MAHTARRSGRLGLPDLPDWFESLPSRLTWPPLAELYTMRIEEAVEEGRYVVRVEIPGIDPSEDLDVTVQEGLLTVKAERAEKTEEKQHSEFRYGSFSRTVALPPGAREDDIQAEYSAGILTVSVGLRPQEREPRHVRVARKD